MGILQTTGYMAPVQLNMDVPNADSLIQIAGLKVKRNATKARSRAAAAAAAAKGLEIPDGTSGARAAWIQNRLGLNKLTNDLNTEFEQRVLAGESESDVLTDPTYIKRKSDLLRGEMELSIVESSMKTDLETYNENYAKLGKDGSSIQKSDWAWEGTGSILFERNLDGTINVDKPIRVLDQIISESQRPYNPDGSPAVSPVKSLNYTKFEETWSRFIAQAGESDEQVLTEVYELMKKNVTGESIDETLKKITIAGGLNVDEEGKKSLGPLSKNAEQIAHAYQTFITTVSADSELSKVLTYYQSLYYLRNYKNSSLKDDQKEKERAEKYKSMLDRTADETVRNEMDREFEQVFFDPRRKSTLDTWLRTYVTSLTPQEEIDKGLGSANNTLAFVANPDSYDERATPGTGYFHTVGSSIQRLADAPFDPSAPDLSAVELQEILDTGSYNQVEGEVPAYQADLKDMPRRAINQKDRDMLMQAVGEVNRVPYPTKTISIGNSVNEANERIAKVNSIKKLDYGSEESRALIGQELPDGATLPNGAWVSSAWLEDNSILISKEARAHMRPAYAVDQQTGERTNEFREYLTDENGDRKYFSVLDKNGNVVTRPTVAYDFYYSYKISVPADVWKEIPVYEKGRFTGDGLPDEGKTGAGEIVSATGEILSTIGKNLFEGYSFYPESSPDGVETTEAAYQAGEKTNISGSRWNASRDEELLREFGAKKISTGLEVKRDYTVVVYVPIPEADMFDKGVRGSKYNYDLMKERRKQKAEDQSNNIQKDDVSQEEFSQGRNKLVTVPK